MIVKQIPLSGAITTNAFFYINEQTGHGFLLDPAAEPEKLLSIINDNHWTIEKMLITHGHFDHIGAVEKLHQQLQIPYYIFEQGKTYLEDTAYNLSTLFGTNITLTQARYLKDNDVISLSDDSSSLKLIHTPGHTFDSSVYYDKQNHLAFVGDTIFKGSIGRSDLPGGDMLTLKNSILNKVLQLPDDTILYSGHSDPTTIATEKRTIGFFF